MNHLQTLTRYKAWADERLYASIAKMPSHERTAPRPILFGSLLRTLNHVYAMDRVWKAHLEGKPHGFTTRNPEECPPFEHLRKEQNEIDQWYVNYADDLRGSEFDQTVSFRFIGGDTATMTREGIVLHVVNHATYHRGHIADMMYHDSMSPPTTDLPVYLALRADPE